MLFWDAWALFFGLVSLAWLIMLATQQARPVITEVDAILYDSRVSDWLHRPAAFQNLVPVGATRPLRAWPDRWTWIVTDTTQSLVLRRSSDGIVAWDADSMDTSVIRYVLEPRFRIEFPSPIEPTLRLIRPCPLWADSFLSQPSLTAELVYDASTATLTLPPLPDTLPRYLPASAFLAGTDLLIPLHLPTALSWSFAHGLATLTRRPDTPPDSSFQLRFLWSPPTDQLLLWTPLVPDLTSASARTRWV